MLINICLRKYMVTISKNDAERQHYDDIEQEYLIDHDVDVRLLETIASLIEDQFCIVSCVQDE